MSSDVTANYLNTEINLQCTQYEISKIMNNT